MSFEPLEDVPGGLPEAMDYVHAGRPFVDGRCDPLKHLPPFGESTGRHQEDRVAAWRCRYLLPFRLGPRGRFSFEFREGRAGYSRLVGDFPLCDLLCELHQANLGVVADRADLEVPLDAL